MTRFVSGSRRIEPIRLIAFVIQIITLAFVAIFFATEPRAASNIYSWHRVAVGGGGYVTGIVIHPSNSHLMYIRTDNGGAYRFDANMNLWTWITRQWAFQDKNYYGIDGISVDPSDDRVVYIVAGKNLNEQGGIFKSIDRGESWTRLKDVAFAGNGPLRWAGEPIAVDPNNSAIVYVGTRKNGLLKTNDGGETWAAVPDVPIGEIGVGIRAIAIDPVHRVQGRSQRIYAGVYGAGIYESLDAGATWSPIHDSPSQPHRMTVATNGRLYVTARSGVFIYENGKWQEVSPSRYAFTALDVAKDNPDRVIVGVDYYGSHRASPMKTPIYLSVDGGHTWTEIVSKSAWGFAAPWYARARFSAATSDLRFDPHKSNKVWIADWYQIMVSDNIDAPVIQWRQMIGGIEQLSTLSLSTPSTGAVLLSGAADNRGFRHVRLDSYPDNMQDISIEPTGIDFCESDPNSVFEVGGERAGVAAYSTDNGASWVKTFWPFGGNGKVAVSATDPRLVVVVPRNSSPKRTTNRGLTWENTMGAPVGGVTDFWSGQIPIAADRVIGTAFYYLNRDGNFYRSTDGGATWARTWTLTVRDGYMVKAAPGVANAVWISTHDGLYHSSDGGTTFSRLKDVDQALLFAFGKNAEEKPYPSVFLYGRVFGIDGIYRSDDMGKTWIMISDSRHEIGINPKVMEGDRQVFGRVYIGTGGGGIFYGELAEGK